MLQFASATLLKCCIDIMRSYSETVVMQFMEQDSCVSLRCANGRARSVTCTKICYTGTLASEVMAPALMLPVDMWTELLKYAKKRHSVQLLHLTAFDFELQLMNRDQVVHRVHFTAERIMTQDYVSEPISSMDPSELCGRFTLSASELQRAILTLCVFDRRNAHLSMQVEYVTLTTTDHPGACMFDLKVEPTTSVVSALFPQWSAHPLPHAHCEREVSLRYMCAFVKVCTISPSVTAFVTDHCMYLIAPFEHGQGYMLQMINTTSTI
jgi:hypothetical protein